MIVQEINIEQNTPAWLEWRKNKIGASDSTIIMGASPWMTPFQLWEEKLGLSKPRETTSAMQRGKDLEKEARNLFEDLYGLIMFPKVLQHPLFEWMIASMDGVDFDNTCFVEIKCPGKADHQTAVEGKIPEKYIPQIQHQFCVSGLKKGYYFSYYSGSSACIEVTRDEEYIAKMLIKEREFWHSLQEFDPPDLTDRDCMEIVSSEWNALVDRYKYYSKGAKDFEIEAESAKRELIRLSGEKNARGAGIRLTKNFRKGNVDVDALAAMSGLDKELFRKPPTNYWRIS